MEQEVEAGYTAVCSTCLSSDRNLISLNCLNQVHQVFRMLMYDFAGDRFGESMANIEQMVCWECLALMRRFARFKRQVHSAQDHLRILALSPAQETLDHQYMSHSLSPLETVTRVDYDKIYFDYSTREEWPYHATLTADSVKDDLDGEIQMDEHNMLGLPEIVLEGSVMSHLVVSGDDALLLPTVSYAPPALQLAVSPLTDNKVETVIVQAKQEVEDPPKKIGYITTYMSEEMMQAAREEDKNKIQYAGSGYKCELCIVGFYSQQQVKDHFMVMHRPKPGCLPCRVCFVYVEEAKMRSHVDMHYIRHTCNTCGHAEYSSLLMSAHIKAHTLASKQTGAVNIGDASMTKRSKSKKKRKNEVVVKTEPPAPGDLRRLLSRTVIEGYQCLECEMFFKSSRARKTHVMRYHREGFQCDHCKKRFVNKTTLATHLRLHEGPLPREECPICHKMVRSIQIKYHIRRHENKERYECTPCSKVFSHLATYQAHLKYSRAHATEEVFKFPCPMCNKGYPSKEQMQDHFNYNHLGKTSHKCPVCDKPISSRSNVEKHMQRVHGQKKEKPRTHVCQTCRKGFTDRKSLVQHEVVHSGDRPLSCDICQQTFKQKASLYTHRKRVHKVFPLKRDVYYMDKTDV